MEEGRNDFKILTGKPTGKKSLRRPRRRWEENTRMDLEEIAINAGNWVDSIQHRVCIVTCLPRGPWFAVSIRLRSIDFSILKTL